MDIINIAQSAVLGFTEIPAAGLNDLWTNILTNWLTPIYLAAVAIFAIVFLKDRAWMKLVAFVGIAAVVGVLIFAGKELFGSKDTGLTGVANKASKDINTVDGSVLVGAVQAPSFAELPSGFSG